MYKKCFVVVIFWFVGFCTAHSEYYVDSSLYHIPSVPFVSMFTWVSEDTGCPAWILKGLGITESSMRVDAVGDFGNAEGAYQIHKRSKKVWVAAYGKYDPYNLLSAMTLAGKIMKDRLSFFEDPRDAIASYRQGIGGVLKNGRTDWYVDRVIANALL
jgi:hypothetical protein